MSLPKALAKYNLIAKKTKSLQQKDPVMAYYFKMFLLNACFDHKDDPEVKALLLQYMDELEEEKRFLADQIGEGFNPTQYITDFGNRLFFAADKQDRAGNADRTTVARFLDASLHYQILSQFGEVPQDIQQRLKYAEYKATDIARCLKAGIKPKPGGPDEVIEEPKEEKDDDLFPSVPQSSPQSDVIPSSDSSVMFPDVPQLPTAGMPAPQDSSVDEETLALERELAALNNKRIAPSVQQTKEQDDINNELNNAFANRPTIPPKPKPQPKEPAKPQPQPKPKPKPKPEPVQEPTPEPVDLNYTPSMEAVLRAQKNCKFANSSLDYDDYKTCVKNLLQALKEITGRDYVPK